MCRQEGANRHDFFDVVLAKTEFIGLVCERVEQELLRDRSAGVCDLPFFSR
jgi:hypothetical protein